MFEQLGMQYVQTDGYSYFNYALLHGTGLSHVLDVMRYEHAFLVRPTDLAFILEAAQDYAQWVTRRYAILLCRYDFKGKTRPSWTPQRLLSDQELELITDPLQLMGLGVNSPLLRPPKKLKLQHVLPLEGPISWIVETMFLNKAMPHTEADAHAMERAFFEDKPLKAELTNFGVSKTLWTIPKRPDELDFPGPSAN